MKLLPFLGIYFTFCCLSVHAQSSCIDNPQFSFCCDPKIDICKPHTTQIKYGVTAGDLCVNGYPSPQSCGGTYSWRADFSSAMESSEWRRLFVSAYWISRNDICTPIYKNQISLAWSAPEEELNLYTMQFQKWETILSTSGTPPGGGNYSCNFPTVFPQPFYIYRYLKEDDCEGGFIPGRLKTDDTRVCTKKVPLEISIDGPDSTQALPSLVGPIIQIIKVTRLGVPQPDIAVTIEQIDLVNKLGKTISGITNDGGEFSILYVPPYLKSIQIELLAKCAACKNHAQKKISVSQSNFLPQICYKNDF